MEFSNKTWKNIFLIYSVGIFLLFLLKILPDYQIVFQQLYKRIFESSGSEGGNSYETALFQNHAYKEQINQLISVDSSKNSLSSVIDLLNANAAKCRAIVLSIKPEETFTKESLRILPLEIILEGNYEAIYNFINMSELAPKIVTVKVISMKEDKKKIWTTIKLDVYIDL